MPVKGMVMTEMQKLKIKKTKGTASPADLTRLKQLQDGEPLSEADLENAKKREEERDAKDKDDYKARQETKVGAPMTQVAGPPPVAEVGGNVGEAMTPPSLDPPPEHPRIVALKEALLPFTQIEANDTRPNEFVLFTRGISITAGDVRKARKAMTL